MRVPTGRVGRVTVTLSERVVGVVTGHHPAASHLVKSVLALIGSRVSVVLRDTDSETELVKGHVAKKNSQRQSKMAKRRQDSLHPLLVRNVRASSVSGHVTTNGVTKTSGTVGVQFTSLVTLLNVKMGKVTETLDLPVERSLDKVDGGKNTIRDDSGIVSGFYAVSQPFCHFRRDSVSSKGDANLRTHQATSSASVSPMTELGTGGAKRQLKT